MDLLQSDSSLLTIDQWTLLSNLLHCYDEHSHFSAAQHYLLEQNQLPPKIRFRWSSVRDILSSLVAGAQQLFEKNKDFLSLSSHDRSLVLQQSIQYTGALGAAIIVQKLQLICCSLFCRAAEGIYGVDAFNDGAQAGSRLDCDVGFVKLALAILMFSSFDHLHYTNPESSNLKDVKAILRIQDNYVELAWRYLIYKYDHQRAVLCFSNMIRCFFLLHKGVVAVSIVEEYNTMINTLVQQTEASLRTSK